MTVNSYDPRENTELSLRVNGKVDTSALGDMLPQLLLGHIPLLLHSYAEEALVGLGSGVTCGAVLRHDSVKRLNVVEISPEVVEVSRFFQHSNDDALNNDRLHLTLFRRVYSHQHLDGSGFGFDFDRFGKAGVRGLGKYGRTFFPAAHSRAFGAGERASLPGRP